MSPTKAVHVWSAGLALAAASLCAHRASANQARLRRPAVGRRRDVGEHGLKHLNFLAETINAKSGVPAARNSRSVAYDNKGSPQESLRACRRRSTRGFASSPRATAPARRRDLEFVTKYNERNPGKEVLYFNYAAVDPALTNEKCSFWHFRLDANSDIKMDALTNFMKGQPGIKKVYIIGQNYSLGHAVRGSSNATIKRKRPDMQIVGDELHPLARSRDFAPYIAKIKASGADSVITGNWGNDISLLLKAADDAGLRSTSTPTTPAERPAHGDQADRRGPQRAQNHRLATNVPAPEVETFADKFLKKYGGTSHRAGAPAHEQPDGHVR